MKKIIKIMIVGVMVFMIFSLSGFEVKAESCGQVTRKNIYSFDCKIQSYPSCDLPTNDIVYNCYTEGTKCVYNYAWEDCYYNSNNGDPKCDMAYNTVKLDCSDTTSGGGGGGGFNWFSCPAGQVKSCGSPSEAQAQGKYACLYKSYCDTYFSPELIEAPAPCNENPASAICQWNCSCCPTGSYRSCTLGTSCIITATKER